MIRFVVLTLLASPALADDLPLCDTSTGIPGQIFGGEISTVGAPVDYASLSTDIAGVFAYASLRDDTRSLFMTEPTEASGTVTFRSADAQVVHRCTLNVVPFDPDLHSLDALTVGECAFETTRGPTALSVGAISLQTLPDELVEHAVSSEEVISFQTHSSRDVSFIGLQEGTATFAWFVREDESVWIAGICPITVGPKTDTPVDLPVCTDDNDQPISLNVGDTAQLSLSRYRHNLNFIENRLSNPMNPLTLMTEVQFGSQLDIDAVEVVATSQGTATLVVEDGENFSFDLCKIAIDNA